MAGTPHGLAGAAAVVRGFAIDGEVVGLRAHGRGHIHDSFVATLRHAAAERRFLLQRLNARVFPDPATVVRNVAVVTAHLRRRLAEEGANGDGREALTLVPARAGGWLVRDGEGEAWRMYEFIEGSVVHERAAAPATARIVARGFARFLRLIADAPPLAEPLPHFHDTVRRLAAFAAALRADVGNRAAGARAEIAAIEGAAPLAHALVDARDAGVLPVRPVHNDTKVNNLLCDAATGRELCVIDLDTVMPGLALYDFGDLVRTVASASAEDEPDPARVAARPEFVLAAARGWIEGSAGTLLAEERRRLVLAARLLAFECGVRFLTDYLAGDVYFRTTRPGQNLDRCRAQLALERSLRAQEPALQRALERIADAPPETP